MKKFSLPSRLFSFLILLTVFLTAPLAGVMLAGREPLTYLRFPPTTTAALQSSFSWIAFGVVILFVMICTWPFWKRLTGNVWTMVSVRSKIHMPWWGWAALTGLVLFWVLAWSRFPWFESFQRHTFFPLWFCFIVFLNALAIQLSGKSLITRQPVYFSLLFPVSATFWWGFEYLNRFVNNWHYLGIEQIGGWQYFWEASLAFSTVLPAVMSMRFVLLQLDVFSQKYRNFPAASWLTSRGFWDVTGAFSVVSLVAVGWLPDVTYPLIWIIPGLLWVAWQRWRGYINPMLNDVSKGDYTLLWASACAALLCGFFWEMWNFYSAAKWVYSLPALHRFKVFEMPLAGYAGYLPFGVICALVAPSLLSTLREEEEAVQAAEEKA